MSSFIRVTTARPSVRRSVSATNIECGPSQVIYVAAAALILWQNRSLHINELSASGYILLSQRLFVIVTLVLTCVKLALGFRDFHSQLHNEEYIPSTGTASGAMKDGGGGDGMEDFANYCRSQGFPLPGQSKSDPESDDEECGYL
ncbi:hypothetical protein V5799_011515 [Amblyomma americanum]|uniref:Uncharacterized protein n=1 Tax=Amblyomma americanum TaxID=6943 RepID=A0AAQ4EGY4_AMBAM